MQPPGPKEIFAAVNTLRSYLARMFLVVFSWALILVAGAEAQDSNETLASTDNAYNPIPSPDGRYIAYVRTGWGRPGGSGGFGRSNLVSEVIVIDEKGVPTTAMPLADMFLGGWTHDGRQLVCFRDLKYALVSADGKQVIDGHIPNNPNKHPAPEWVAYSPSLAAIVWSRLDGDSHGVIETASRTIVKEEVLRQERVVPSPDGRYLAVFGEFPQGVLRVYDLRLKSWTDLGRISIHPDKDWSYIQPDWNPWFADGSRLVFLRDSTLVIARPDGKAKTEINIDGTAGLPVPSQDGQSIAYVTFEPHPSRLRPDLQFWGGTTIFVVSTSTGARARPITEKNQDEVYDLKWLGNDTLLFDRVADEVFYRHARIWKVAVPR
jgi:WD40-like Beta Propeller Repeat